MMHDKYKKNWQNLDYGIAFPNAVQVRCEMKSPSIVKFVWQHFCLILSLSDAFDKLWPFLIVLFLFTVYLLLDFQMLNLVVLLNITGQ